MQQMLAAKLIACVAILSAATAAIDDTPVDGRFDVGGRSIRLACKGIGGPAVVIDAEWERRPSKTRVGRA